MSYIRTLLTGVNDAEQARISAEAAQAIADMEPAFPPKPTKIVGINVEKMRDNYSKGLDTARARLAEIEIEIDRLRTEHANTSLAIKAGEAALDILGKPNIDTGIVHKHVMPKPGSIEELAANLKKVREPKTSTDTKEEFLNTLSSGGKPVL